MAHVERDSLSPERDAARAIRVEMYADWLIHDVDGLTFNITHPTASPFPRSTAILAETRKLVALALARIDRAIELDRAKQEREPA